LRSDTVTETVVISSVFVMILKCLTSMLTWLKPSRMVLWGN